MRAFLLMTSYILAVLVLSGSDGDPIGCGFRPLLGKMNFFSGLQKMTRITQNFVAEQISKGARVLPAGQRVDLRPLLEMNRAQMRSGWPGLNVPALDPLRLAHVSLDTDEGNISVRGYLNDSQVTGISAVIARNLTLNLVNQQLNFGLVFPQLTSVGRYKINGTLPKSLLVNGQGSYSVTAWNLVLAGSLRLKMNQKNLQVDDVIVRVSVEKFKVDLEQFLGGGDVGRVMSEALSRAAPAILDKQRDKVSRQLSSRLQESLNTKLASLDSANLCPLLLAAVFNIPGLTHRL